MYHQRLIFLILGCSFLLRLCLAYVWKDSFLRRGNRYSIIIPLSENILEGKYSIDGDNPDITQEPFYPLCISGIRAIFGIEFLWLGVVVFQGILGILSSILIYALSKQLFDEKVAVIALAGMSFYPFAVLQSISIADTTIFIFLLTLAIYMFIKIVSAEYSFVSTLLISIIVAVVLITRDVFIIFIPFLMVFLFINLPFKRAWRSTVTIMGIAAIIVLPWVLRNHSISGRPIISAHGAEVLLMGNSPRGWQLIENNTTIDAIRRVDDSLSVWNKYPIHSMREPRAIIAASDVYNAEAMKNISENVPTFLRMLVVKFIKFWSWQLYPPPVNTLYIGDRVRSAGYALSYIPILILGITGLTLSFQKWRILSIIYFVIIAFTAVHMLTIPLTRYRIPLDIFLLVFASFTMVQLFNRLRRS